MFLLAACSQEADITNWLLLSLHLVGGEELALVANTEAHCDKNSSVGSISMLSKKNVSLQILGLLSRRQQREQPE